ncbi:Protein D2 [Aphelenchoides besseyi]|nr:Protein D2 [Aphelenchoides besseyi]
MNSIVFFLFLLFVFTSARRCYDAKTIKFWYDYNDVVPDVFKKAPQNHATVKYGKQTVDLGHVINPRFTKNQPKVFWDAKPHSLYTLAMIDIDAPSRKDPQFAQFRHWLVMNIPGNRIAKGKVISSYFAVGPPEKTRWHRYVLAIFKQNGRIKSVQEKEDGSDRVKWNVTEFAARNGLKHVAGSYFVARNDKQ